MTLESGTRFGHYEIGAQIGVGGMGEVYRATDTTLDRQVAIKVLPASLVTDAGRIARFEQEAKTLASLNHTSIAQIHGLERAGGTTGIVMELVEGPTLAERIAEGPVAPDEALDIAMQIADALEAAHEKGIIHRDLKPANVKLKPDGTVKVLDFGIAKAFDPQLVTSGSQPVMTTPVTQTGVILGTAAYMSPEQARGKPVDERTDIWAFGCVLYEMLTGQPVFAGEDVSVTLARVLERDTDVDALPASVSAAVRQTIELCLKKDARKRIADIRDVRLALAGELEPTVARQTGDGVADTRAGRGRIALAASLALVVGAVVAGIGVRVFTLTAPGPVNRFSYAIPGEQQIRNVGRNVIAFSPDGRRFVYNAMQGLYLRELGELQARLLPGTDGDVTNPFFSPDGQSIAYWESKGNSAGLMRIATSGGAPVVVTAGVQNLFGGSWAGDNTIFIGQPEGIFRVSANGGEAELVVEAQEGERLASPFLLPDGDTVLFSARAPDTSWETGQVFAESLSTGKRTLILKSGADARYVPTGHLVYALGSDLFAVAFDVDTLTVTGGAVPIVQNAVRAGATASANFDVSTDGTLVYLTGLNTTRGPLSIRLVDRDGNDEPLGMDDCLCLEAAYSTDGTRIAVTLYEPGLSDADIWIWSMSRRTLTRLTFEPGVDRLPVWSPDGERIAYARSDGIYARRADGTGTTARLLEGPDLSPWSWSDAGQIVFVEGQPPRSDIGMFSIGAEPVREMLLAGDYAELRPALSPDGQWLAYESTESGESEIYVRPFPSIDDGKWQVSSGRGREPKWAADGHTLFYAGDANLMATTILPGPAFEFGTPEPIFDLRPYAFFLTRHYDVADAGQRFVITGIASGLTEKIDIVIVENWLGELERLAPAGD